MALTEGEIIDYMRDELGVDTSDIEADTLLFSSGIIDSFALVSVITFIESNCNFRMSPADVNLENMDSIGRILAFVRRRTAA